MKHFSLILAMLCIVLNLCAQEIVYSVERVYNPPSNSLLPYKYDLNNDITAQLEISSDDMKFVDVEGNAVGGIEYSNGRNILHLCDGSRRIRLFSEGNLPLDIDFSQFEETKKGVKGGCFYVLRISQERKKESVGLGSRILTFKTEEPVDSLIVNNEQWIIKNGISQKLVPFGVYKYQAFLHGAAKMKGEVTVTGGLGSEIVKLTSNK